MARRIGPTGKTRAGRRVNIWLKPEHDKIAKQIDNLSEFVQLALDQAVAIMAFDIIKQKKGIVDNRPLTKEAVDRWNDDHPLNLLTQKRLRKNGTTPHALPPDSPLSD